MKIQPADDMDKVREMFREYETEIGIDLCFQGFEEELKTLPGKYAPPKGIILFACEEDELAGCAALRPLEEGVCEMKRLYVKPEMRGRGIGTALAKEIVAFAKNTGYKKMRVDTLDSMTTARAIYEGLGFKIIGGYYESPLENVSYMELDI